jgi:hypothetical protein
MILRGSKAKRARFLAIPARAGAAPIVFLTPIRGRRNSILDVALEARILSNERHPTNPFYWVNAKEPIMLEGSQA